MKPYGPLALALLAGCGDVLGPNDAGPYSPPSYYASWYSAMEQCTGLLGKYRDIRWIELATASVRDGFNVWGEYRPASHTIAIVPTTDRIVDSVTVTHEMIHDILWRNGWRPPNSNPTREQMHPNPPFGACAP